MRSRPGGKLLTTKKKTGGGEMGERGFTLVELLVTLAVGVILLAIAIPSYSVFVRANRLASVANDLVSAIHMTRSEAIKRGKRVTLCKTGDATSAAPTCDAAASWQHGWLVFVDSGVRGVIDSTDVLLRVHGPAPAGTTITPSNYKDFLSYLASGVSQGSNGLANGTLAICIAGARRDIIINSTGRPRLRSDIC